MCRGHEKESLPKGNADRCTDNISSLLPFSFILEQSSLKDQRRSIMKRKEHLATSYGGTRNRKVLVFIGDSPVIHDAIFATSAQFMR